MNRFNRPVACLLRVCFFLALLLILLYSTSNLIDSDLPVSETLRQESHQHAIVDHFTWRKSRERIQRLIDSISPQNDPLLASWLSKVYTGCEADFVAYNGSFAVFYNVTLTASMARKFRSLKPVYSAPSDDDNLYNLQKSFLQMQCNEPLRYLPKPRPEWPSTPLIDLLRSIDFKPRKVDKSVAIVTGRAEQRATIVVQRREFLNLFHTAADWHSAFLMLVLFRLNVSDVQVLFLDAHVPGLLDQTWTTLFNRFEQLGDLHEPVTYSTLISSIWGYNSLLFHPTTYHYVPLLNEYRRFVYLAHSLHEHLDRDLNCQKLSITFVSRRPYNLRKGAPLDRMIANEDELIDALYSYFANLSGRLRRSLGLDKLRLIQLEKFSFIEQLKIMSQTDILIGMHGAGLTHTLHIPSKSALIELYPLNLRWEEIVLPLFRRMAIQRNLFYTSWRNKDPGLNKPDGYTYVPVEVLLSLVSETLHKICGLSL